MRYRAALITEIVGIQKQKMTLPVISRIQSVWCEERDSNPHTRGALTPEASASTNSATFAYLTNCHFFSLNGVADGARTHDNRNHNPGLYQLSYSHHNCFFSFHNTPAIRRTFDGAPDRIRTCDLCLRRAALYPAELRALRCRTGRIIHYPGQLVYSFFILSIQLLLFQSLGIHCHH